MNTSPVGKRKLNVAVPMGGPSVEHDVSIKTGAMILKALPSKRYGPFPVTVTRDGRWLIGEDATPLRPGAALDRLAGDLATDVVFIAMHGSPGEDGTVQGLLEVAGLPYTGSGVLASALAMDKAKSAELFAAQGLATPEQLLIESRAWERTPGEISRTIWARLGLPCVIKPSNAGSSVGVGIVRDPADLEEAVGTALRIGSVALAQEYLEGTEVTCGVLDGEEALALPPTEIAPRGSRFFDYNAKYTPGATEEITPPRLQDNLIREIQLTALKAHKILGCAGMSRTDMIIAREIIFILETNTIPGMTETSLLPRQPAAAGIPFPELLDRIIRAALCKKAR